MSKNTVVWQGKDKEWAWCVLNGWITTDNFDVYGYSHEKAERQINNAHVIIMSIMERDRGEHTIPTPFYE